MFQLPDPEHLADDWANASGHRFDDADIATAHAALADLPLARRLQRFSLLKASTAGAMKKDKAPVAIFPYSPAATARASPPPNGTGWLLRSTSKNAAFSSTRRTCWSLGRSASIPSAGIIDLNASADWSGADPGNHRHRTTLRRSAPRLATDREPHQLRASAPPAHAGHWSSSGFPVSRPAGGRRAGATASSPPRLPPTACDRIRPASPSRYRPRSSRRRQVCRGCRSPRGATICWPRASASR